MKYKIALEHSEEGYSVSVRRAFPAAGPRVRQRRRHSRIIRAAIGEYLVVRDELLRDADVREVEVV